MTAENKNSLSDAFNPADTLEDAMERQDWLAAEQLLAAGAKPPPCEGDPNKPKTAGQKNSFFETETALTCAIKYTKQYLPIFIALANGANVNLPNEHGQMPLSLAVQHDWPFVAVQLVKHGAWRDPLKPDANEIIDPVTGATRLLSVILEGDDFSAVQTILDCGANPNKPDHYGLTPLALARAMNWPDVENLLIKYGANPNTVFPDPNQMTVHGSLLYYAAGSQYCHANYVHALIQAGAKVDVINNENLSPAHCAALLNKPYHFLALQSSGVDIFAAIPPDSLPLLHCACLGNAVYIAALILEKCPPEEINRPYSENKLTPLHMAAGKDGAALIKLLLSHGALPNLEDSRGETALHRAVHSCNPEVVQALINGGTDVAKENNREGYDPLFFSLLHTIHSDNIRIVQMLLDAGTDPNAQATRTVSGHKAGDSLVYTALYTRSYEIAAALFKAGADPHGTAHNGKSAMYHCLHLRDTKGVRLLLENGFDPLKYFDYTDVQHVFGSLHTEHHRGSAYDCAKELAEKFGQGTAYSEMLQMIEEHIAAKGNKPKPALKPLPGPGL